MSLILNNSLFMPMNVPEDDLAEDQRNLGHLDRYMAVVENNRKSADFVPDDVAVALDMAGFVRGQINGRNVKNSISAARLALSLVQRPTRAPVQ